LAGLAIAKDSGGFYDRFRQRLMFPVKDVRNRVIAFSGRIIVPDPEKTQAKYVNSPESPIYIKGNHLYGLAAARQAIQETGYVLLVEGQMDVVACAAAGLKNTVASLGTAFTPNQARLLQRFTKNVVIAYDKDSAGLEATDKAIGMLVPVDCTVKVLDIPAKDPDEYIQQAGVEALKEAAEHAVDYVQFKLDRVMQKYNLLDRVQKATAAKECVAIIDFLDNSVLRDDYLTYVSKRLMVGREILHDLGKNATMQSLARGGYVSTKHTPAPFSKYQKAEILLCKVFLSFPELRARVLEKVTYDLFEPEWQPLVKYLSESTQAYDVLIVELDAQATPEAAQYKQLITQVLLHPEEAQENMVADYVAVVMHKGKERRRQELRDGLHAAEQAGDDNKAQEIMTQLAAL
jgi:DNA primase